MTVEKIELDIPRGPKMGPDARPLFGYETVRAYADRQGATGGDIFRAAPELRRAVFRLNSINESECNGIFCIW